MRGIASDSRIAAFPTRLPPEICRLPQGKVFHNHSERGLAVEYSALLPAVLHPLRAMTGRKGSIGRTSVNEVSMSDGLPTGVVLSGEASINCSGR